MNPVILRKLLKRRKQKKPVVASQPLFRYVIESKRDHFTGSAFRAQVKVIRITVCQDLARYSDGFTLEHRVASLDGIWPALNRILSEAEPGLVEFVFAADAMPGAEVRMNQLERIMTDVLTRYKWSYRPGTYEASVAKTALRKLQSSI